MNIENENEQLMQWFLQSLSRPEEELLPLFWPGDASLPSRQDQLKRTCQILFQQVENLAKLYDSVIHKSETSNGLSGLDELFVGEGMDAETLWGQAELQNEAVIALVKSNLKKIIKTAESQGQDQVRLIDMGDIMSENDAGSNEEDEDDSSNSDEGSDGLSDEDNETRRIRARMERAMEDMDDSDVEDDNDEVEEETERDKKDEEESLEDPAAEELNDGFFDMQEMEEFADEEEEYLPEDEFGTVQPEEHTDEPKKSFHQRQREGDIDSGSDDDDEKAFKAVEKTVKRRKYRKDAEIEALYKLYQETPEDDDGDDDVVNMTAADFFGKPNKKYYDKWDSKRSEQREPKADINDDDADSWGNHDFNDDGPGWRDEESSRKKVTFGKDKVKEYGDAVEGEVDAEEFVATEDQPIAMSSSSHVRHAEKLRRQTEQIEKELLAEKPWQMTGESKGTSRPVNSLLEATPEFEVATKMAPLITVEHTANLEDVIKRRILDEDWDDVIPRELPDIGWNKKRGELPEVSQEKSKLGLGELYEREYLKKVAGYDVDATEKQSEEEKARSEMKALFANLCSKLDALSNYHFAPRPVADEAEVRAVTTPAIAMEEVLPLHVSDARGVAPEEVYGKKKGRDGVLRGDTELDQVRVNVIEWDHGNDLHFSIVLHTMFRS